MLEMIPGVCFGLATGLSFFAMVRNIADGRVGVALLFLGMLAVCIAMSAQWIKGK